MNNDDNFDFPSADNYLKTISKDTTFIRPGIIYNKKDIEKMVDLRVKYGAVLFDNSMFPCNLSKISKPGSPLLFTIYVSCPECGNNNIYTLCKTKLTQFLSFKKDILYPELKTNKKYKSNVFKEESFICKSCQQNIKEKIKKEKEEREKNKPTEEELIKIRQKRIEDYTNNYLNPNLVWNNPKNVNENFREVLYHPCSHFNEIANYIKSIPYNIFLKTPYWKAISAYKRKKSKYKCELCNNSYLLHIHHKTYEIHGYEIFNIDSLIVLCKSCHEKFHDIYPEENTEVSNG